MIFLDNIIFSNQRAGGISMVWSNLIENLLNITEDIRFLEYSNSKSNIFRNELEIPDAKVITLGKKSNLLSFFKSPQIISEKPFIFHSSYFRTCNNSNAINVTTVHDFIYEQGITTLKQKIRIWLDYKAIRKSDAIVCISENTKKDLLKFLPDTDIRKVHVIYNGVSDEYFNIPVAPYPQYRDFILFVGGRYSYKNFDFTVKSMKQTNLKLLICGAPLSDSEIKLCEEHLKNRYEVIEYPSNTELNKIYNSVFCLAYPSSYEGFGLPILEAQRAGCPVIALYASSIPEVIGNDELLMRSLTENNFTSLLSKLKTKTIRQQIIDNGFKNSHKFSWEKMASEYCNLYQRLLLQKQ